MGRFTWNVELEMFTVPELDWFSDGRWQTDVKWCGSDIKGGKMSWMQETEERDWLLNATEKKASQQCFSGWKPLQKGKKQIIALEKNTHQPPLLLLQHPHPPQQTHSERPDPQQAPAETTELHQLAPAEGLVRWVNHSYPKENINPKNKSLLIMCHPASLLCPSPKMSSFAEHKAELSQAAAHLAETRAHCTITGNKRLSLTFPLFGSTCNAF